MSGDMTVLAAASLTEAFNNARTELTQEHPRLDLSISFAGSQSIVAQVEAGAPADVIATADQQTLQELVDDGLVEQPVIFARNELALAVAPGNPKGITGVKDLGRSDLAVVVCDDSVPAGHYAQQVMDRAGVVAHPITRPLDVKSALALVVGGEADVAVVYVTDIKAAGKQVAQVQLPEADNVIANYPVAVVRSSKHQDAARSYVTDLISGDGRAALDAAGFLPPAGQPSGD